MTVNVKSDGGKITLVVDGKLGTTSASELERTVKENIDSASELIFDLEKVDYLASAGIRVLLSSAKAMKDKGSMKIINVTEPVMEVLNFTGMADALDVTPLS